jgi:hypothetical protein
MGGVRISSYQRVGDVTPSGHPQRTSPGDVTPTDIITWRRVGILSYGALEM